MFSANENIVLRQHKRRVIEYIESTIPENALELGTSVMVMQVSCRQPGCVPLETAITVVFPKPPRKMKKRRARSAKNIDENAQQQQQKEQQPDEVPSFPKPLVGNLEESRTGGSFKTRILKPLSEVTHDDVLDALPPSFAGGRRTTASLCLKARDMTFAQIGQLVGNDDTEDSREGRRLVAEYLKACLEEYVERGCVAPEWGEQYDDLKKEEDGDDAVENDLDTTKVDGDEKKEDSMSEAQVEQIEKGVKDIMSATAAEDTTSGDTAIANMMNQWGNGNIVFRRPVEEKDQDLTEKNNNTTSMSDKWGKGNIAFRRPVETNNDDVSDGSSKPSKMKRTSMNATNNTTITKRKNNLSTSAFLLQQMEKSQHAPGVRRAGCPCCDPDGAGTYVDKMMGL